MTPRTLRLLAPYRSNHKTVKTMSMRLRQLILMEVLTLDEFYEMTPLQRKYILFPLAKISDNMAVYHNVKQTHG